MLLLLWWGFDQNIEHALSVNPMAMGVNLGMHNATANNELSLTVAHAKQAMAPT